MQHDVEMSVSATCHLTSIPVSKVPHRSQEVRDRSWREISCSLCSAEDSRNSRLNKLTLGFGDFFVSICTFLDLSSVQMEYNRLKKEEKVSGLCVFAWSHETFPRTVRAEKDWVNNKSTLQLMSDEADVLLFLHLPCSIPHSPCLFAAFLSFPLESPSSCSHPPPPPPSVGPHIGRYCGQTSPGRVISYTGILSMTITTDNAIAREGFSANYTIRERSLPPGHEDEGEQLEQWWETEWEGDVEGRHVIWH